MNQSHVMRGRNRSASLKHDRYRPRHIERSLAHEHIPQSVAFEQLHHDVEIAIGGRAEIGDVYRIRMLHATGGASFATKPLLRGLIADESLTQYFDCDRPIDEKVCRPIDGAHPAATEQCIEPILLVKRATQQWIDGNVGDRRVRLKRSLILRADQYFVGVLATTSRALEHSEYQGENFIITQKERCALTLPVKPFTTQSIRDRLAANFSHHERHDGHGQPIYSLHFAHLLPCGSFLLLHASFCSGKRKAKAQGFRINSQANKVG